MVHRTDSSLKRPAKLKKTCVISDIYNDGYEMDFATLKSVKTEIIDYEEVAPPSLSELNVASAYITSMNRIFTMCLSRISELCPRVHRR